MLASDLFEVPGAAIFEIGDEIGHGSFSEVRSADLQTTWNY